MVFCGRGPPALFYAATGLEYKSGETANGMWCGRRLILIALVVRLMEFLRGCRRAGATNTA